MEDAETRFAPGFSVSMLVLASTLFLGGVVLVIGYIVSRLSRSSRASDSPKNAEESEKVKFAESTESTSGSVATGTGPGTTGGGGAASNKRAKNKKRREAQQEFTHSWMVGALKGHTAPVLDVSFSSNGKFLASCAEDCGLRPEEEVLDPGETGPYIECKVSSRESSSSSTKPSFASASTSTSSSALPLPRGKSKSSASSSASTASIGSSTTSVSASSEASSGSSTKEDRAILSRRQRKNRTRVPRDQRQERDDEHEQEQEEELASQQQQQRIRRHHHSRQQVYQNSSTRSSESSQSSSTSVRSETVGSRRNRQSQSVVQKMMHHGATNFGNSGMTGAGNADRTFRSNQRKELNHLSEAALAAMLRSYTLAGDELAYLGYPLECSYYPGYAVVMNFHQHFKGRPADVYHHLDVNAREFVPGSGTTPRIWTEESEVDSGNYSGSSVESSDLEQESSSDSDKNSDIGESSSSSSSTDSSSYSSSCSSSGHGYQYQDRSMRYWTPETYELVVAERVCARCYKNFYVNRQDGEYLQEDRCVYHWGKFRNGMFNSSHRDVWECCQGREKSKGCTSAKMHVWTGLGPGCNGPLEGYVRTQPSTIVPSDGNYGVYALDCEMCFTRRGLELTKVTVVDVDGTVVYDTLVKPDAEVIDYNTRFSGITAKDLSTASKRLIDVQNDLMSFLRAETILIGHALNNDLRALRIIHTTLVDTSVVFPHHLGYPFRLSLKKLARTVLRREIQTMEHDSVEDARIAVDLMLRRVQHDFS